MIPFSDTKFLPDSKMLELEVILKNLEQPESEENWDTLESNLLKLEQLLPKIPPNLLIKELLKPKMKQSLIKIVSLS